MKLEGSDELYLSNAFDNKLDESNKMIPNEYVCRQCKLDGIDHDVINVPHSFTDKRSCWGEGLPTTRKQCTNCLVWDGPWIDARLVGDY